MAVNIGQPPLNAVVVEGQQGVIDAQQMQGCGMKLIATTHICYAHDSFTYKTRLKLKNHFPVLRIPIVSCSKKWISFFRLNRFLILFRNLF